jgi:hypothetical protein
MKIEIITPNATQLRNNIFTAVRNNILQTYEIRVSGQQEQMLTPVGNQFLDIVLLKFNIDPNTNNLVITPSYWNGRTRPNDALYAIVMGMITAALITHFKAEFTSLRTTA